MPIRVNLKEIFPSDPQEINVDKVNFNFNKLLELGIGTPGPIGLTGPQGAAGPVGLVGPQGDRGATWWVDAGDPNLLTFTGLIDGDLYLDTVSFNAWQYDDGTGLWTQIASISSIVNTYLSSISAGLSPFVTDIFGDTFSKYIVFKDRGNTFANYQADTTRGSLSSSKSNVLFLTNFNENILKLPPPDGIGLPDFSFPSNPYVVYDALLKVFVSHAEPGAIDNGRYHVEYGSLYENSLTNITELSQLRHNLKFKFLKNDVSPSTPIPMTNTWINTARYSLSSPDGIFAPKDQNGIFEFITPKYNNEGMSPFEDEITVLLGPAESTIEYSNAADILADGIMITSSTASVTMGLKNSLEELLPLPYSAGNANFSFFDISSGLDGFFFNNNIVQSNGSITQLITNELDILADDSFYTGYVVGHYMNQGIFVGSNTILVSSGAGDTVSSTSIGTITRYDITNPDSPLLVSQLSGDRNPTSVSGTFLDDQHGHIYGRKPTSGAPANIPHSVGAVKDVYEYGKYFVAVLGRVTAGFNQNFIIGETDSNLNNLLVISKTYFTEILNAYRVQVHGKYAWVITNDTIITGPQLSSGSPTYARLVAINISDPENPIVIDSYLESQPGTKYLDFKIFDGKAHVLRYTNYVDVSNSANSKHRLDLLTFDILDPTAFSTLTNEVWNGASIVTSDFAPMYTQNIETLTPNTTSIEYGSLAIKGQDIYIAWEDSMYIIKVSGSLYLPYPATPTVNTLQSTTQLSTMLPPEVIYANDVIVRGRYAYVLVNYTDSTGAVQVYDITDTTAPILVSETRNASLRNSSRLAINGKNIYIVTTQAGSRLRLITLDLNGISSPSATIGSLRTDDIHVLGNAHIKNNLQIKNSLNVGPGGIYIDRGQGLSTDGQVSINFNTENLNTLAEYEFAGLEINMTGEIPDLYEPPIGNNIIAASKITLTDLTKAGGPEFTVVNQRSLHNVDLTGFAFIDRTVISSDSTSTFNGTFYGSSLSGEDDILFSEDFVGHDISFGYFGNTSQFDQWLVGYNISLGSGVTADGNVYGYKFDLKPAASVAGTAYGLYIEGADENLVEGASTLKGTLTLNDHDHLYLYNYVESSQTSQNNQIVSGRYESTNCNFAFTRVGDVVTCTGRIEGGDTITVPLGSIDGGQAWGVGASYSTGGSVILQLKTPTTDQVEILLPNGSSAVAGVKWFTFSYVIA
jgi:hypothetical protein